MDAVVSVLGGFFAAAFGWVLMEFVARPARKFFDLRGEIIRRGAQYANVRSEYQKVSDPNTFIKVPNFSPDDAKKLREAQNAFRDLASQIRAFAVNETAARRLVSIRYDPLGASNALFGLSNSIDAYGTDRAEHMRSLERALGIPTNAISGGGA
jgi:hypothetical protein